MRYILKNVSLSPITIGGVVSVASGADIVVYDDSTFDMHPQIDAILDATENTYVDISYNINYNVVKGYLEYYNDVTPKTIGAFYEWLSEFKRKYQFYKKIQGLGYVTVKLDFNNDRLVVNVVGGTAVDDITIRYNDSDQLEVKDGSIGNAKSADMGEGLIKGRAVSAGTGAPQDLTQSQVHTVIGRGTVNGIAPLDASTKIPLSYLPDSVLLSHYIHIQSATSTTWVINNPFNRPVNISFLDSANNPFITDYTYSPDYTTITATIAYAISGKAILS